MGEEAQDTDQAVQHEAPPVHTIGDPPLYFCERVCLMNAARAGIPNNAHPRRMRSRGANSAAKIKNISMSEKLLTVAMCMTKLAPIEYHAFSWMYDQHHKGVVLHSPQEWHR